MPKTLNAEALRERTLSLIGQYPDGVRTTELQIQIFGDTKDEDEHRRRHQRLYHALKQLLLSKHLTNIGNGRYAKYKLNGNRPKPEIADIPANGHRLGRPRGVKNKHKSNGNGVVLAYIVRDIKSKFSELETLVAELAD